MAAQLDRLQQIHPVSIKDIKEKLQALKKRKPSSLGVVGHQKAVPLVARRSATSLDGAPPESLVAPQLARKPIIQPQQTARPRPPSPIRTPEVSRTPNLGRRESRRASPQRSSTPPLCPSSPMSRRSPSPCNGRHRSPSPSHQDFPPAVQAAIRRRAAQVQRGARLYLLHQPGPRSFLVAADMPEHRFRVVVGPQTCTCGKGPHCVHLLFVLLRVLRLSDVDARLFSKTLKDYEVDDLLKEYANQRRRASLPTTSLPKPHDTDRASSLSGDTLSLSVSASVPLATRGTDPELKESSAEECPTCPICLLEMLDGESVVVCKRGCGNRLHHHCIAVWAQECKRNGDVVLCPLCRRPWQDESSPSLPSPHAKPSSQQKPSTLSPLNKPTISNATPTSAHPNLLPLPSHPLPRPLHCLLRRSSLPSPLPQPPCPYARTSVVPSELWSHFFGADVAACLASHRWSDRESALCEVGAQVGHALRTSQNDRMRLAPWGGCAAIQGACCDVLTAVVADPVYKVYVEALRCLRKMLSCSPCSTQEDLFELQSHVRHVLAAVLFQCADGRNKRSRQLSVATLIEAARGQAGALPVGNMTDYPAPNGLGADFVMDVVLDGGAKATSSWQGLLGRVMVIQRLAEEFPHLLMPSCAGSSTVNPNMIKAIDLTAQAVKHSHATVSRYGRSLLVSLGGLCWRSAEAEAYIWSKVTDLPTPLRAVLASRISRALRDSHGFPAVQRNSIERLQEAALVRAKLLDCTAVSRSTSRGAKSPTGSSVHRVPTFEIPPPTVDPGGQERIVRKSPPVCPLLPDKPKPPIQCPFARKLQSPTLERRLMASLDSSGRSSGRSSWSSSSSAVSFNPASPPVGRRPNFLPLYRTTSSEHPDNSHLVSGWTPNSADCTPSSATPCSVNTPVSFGKEIATPSLPDGAATKLNARNALPQEARVVRTSGSHLKAAEEKKAMEEPVLQDTVEDQFIVLRPVESLPIHYNMKTRLYTEGEHWLRGALLGSGAFSTCYQAVDRTTGTLLAVKQVSFCRNCEEEEEKVMESVWDEILMMARLDHRNILPLVGATRHGNHYNVFVQWMSGGSVSSLLERYGSFSEGVTLRYVHQMLNGLAYLHENHIVHRDLKGANLLVDSTGRHLKIADFGSATKLSSKSTVTGEFQGQLLGTVAFMAPEVLRGESYGRSCDIWSVGCVVIEMVTTLAPWDAENVSNHLALIFRIARSTAPPYVPDYLSFPTRNMVLQCLRVQSEARPTAAQLLSHPCFKHAGIAPQSSAGVFSSSDRREAVTAC